MKREKSPTGHMKPANVLRYKRLGVYAALAILKEQERVFIRHRDYGGTYDYPCDDLDEAHMKFNHLLKGLS